MRWIWLVLPVLAGAWLYLNKPFHIDDTVVLHVAARILENPLRPFDGDLFWLNEPGPLFEVTTNPPLVSYYLALWIALFGEREWVLHGAMLLFVGLIAWGMVRLSTRFLPPQSAPLAVIALMVAPAVLPSVNVMRDISMVGLFLAGLALWIEGLDKRSRAMLVSGALIGGLAAFAKYSGLVFFPIALFYLLLKKETRALPYLLLALLPIALWSLHNLWVYQQPHILYLWESRRGSLPWQDRWHGGIIGLGACMPLWLFALGLWIRQKRFALLAAGVVTAMIQGWLMHTFYEGKWHTQSMFWALGGAFLCATTLLYAWTTPSKLEEAFSDRKTPSTDRLFLTGWLLLTFAYSVWGTPFQATRHLIFALPPLLLLLIPAWEQMKFLRAGIALQGLLTLLALAADYEYAQTYRAFIRETKSNFGSQRVWYAGHWGWMFYAERSGYRQILPDGSDLQPNDVLLIPKYVHKGRIPPDIYENAVLLSEKSYSGSIPLRTMNNFQGAAYYALVRGNAPFVITTEQPLETFQVYRLSLRKTAHHDR